jgi:superfamily II DNA or RNA helicase
MLRRNYETDFIGDFNSVAAGGARAVLLAAPTGSGKIVMSTAIVATAVTPGQPVLAPAVRREIIDQTVSKLCDWMSAPAPRKCSALISPPGAFICLGNAPRHSRSVA